MNSFWDYSFVVTDVETTGPDCKKNSIVEIACVVVEGGEIVRHYSSLVNPHQFIPPFIAQMTGISNEMARSAPEANEIRPEVRKMLENSKSVFVAHNSAFDWSFVAQFMMEGGVSLPTVPVLCTHKLSKNVLPKDTKKNVGALAQYFNFPMRNRHRALDDAMATAKILIELLELLESRHEVKSIEDVLHFQNKQSKSSKIAQKAFDRIKHIIPQLPDVPGIYYFKNKDNVTLYIGKGKSIKKKVESYFTLGVAGSGKIAEMTNNIYNIEWQETESELSATLLQNTEIKRLKSKYNSNDRIFRRYPFIRLSTNEPFPKVELIYNIHNLQGEIYGPFRNISYCNELLDIIDTNYKLRNCEGVLKPEIDFKPCFSFTMSKCYAPCNFSQSKEEYWKEVDNVKRFLKSTSSGTIERLEEKLEYMTSGLDDNRKTEIINRVSKLITHFHYSSSNHPTIDKNNLVAIIPINKREHLSNLIIINNGQLIKEYTIGRKAPLNDIFEYIKKTFFSDYNNTNKIASTESLDEIRIVNSWLSRQYDKGQIIYAFGKKEQQFLDDIQFAVRNMLFDHLPELNMESYQ